MRRLNDREKMILSMRFFEGKTQMEVADGDRYFSSTSITPRKVGDSTNAEICECLKSKN